MSRVVAASAVFGVAFMLLAAGTAIAAFPGKPGPIAYEKSSDEETGEGEGEVRSSGGLYVDPPGRRRKPRPLTSNRTDSQPSYSPDGRRIVLFSVGGEGSGIYVVDSDGSGRRKVTDGGSDPSFFPSGRSIVFSRSDGENSHIYSVRLDGTGLRQLTRGPYDDYDPVVSPNGRRIAFVSDRDPDARRDRNDIFEMRPNGARVRVLIDGPGREEEPDYGPRGRRIAFTTTRGRGPSNIFVAEANGRRLRRVSPCKGRSIVRCRRFSHPSFSPNGRQIAVASRGSRTSSIDLLRSNGSGFADSIDGGSTEEEGFGSFVNEPAWGPRPR